MTKTYAERFACACADIQSERPQRFQLPLNALFHELNQDENRLREAGIDPEAFKAMRWLGFAKETIGMNGFSIHETYRSVAYKRCCQLLQPGALPLPADVHAALAERKRYLEGEYPTLKQA